jgi:hypothetical protein
LNYIKTEVEVERDSFRSSTGTNRFDSGRLYVAPALGIGWNNYIYHPYLLTYSALFEPGYTFLNAGPAGATRETQELTLDGHLTANLLEIKPYGLTLNYNHSHGEIKYDLFDSALVDSQGWGVAGGYREGPVPVTVSFNQSHEDSAGFNQNTTSDETMINLHARNERQKENATELTYQYGVFEREIAASKARYRSANSFQYLSLMDLEHFQKSTLRSTLLFYDIESAGSSSQNLNATLGYNLELAPHLQTYENYSLGWFSGTTSDSIQNYGAAGIQHQLFESLSSGVELHGSTLDSTSGDSSFDLKSAGLSGTINYNKRLGDWGRLFVANSTGYTLNEEQTSGSELILPDESHIVPANGLFQLGQPRVLAILSVTDTNGISLQEGGDYTVNRSLDPWQIHVDSSGPLHVHPGSTVRVAYSVRSNPSGRYSTLANQSQLSLRFWRDMMNVFVRYGLTDNRASSSDFLLQDEEEFQTGADFNWRGLALHGDYTDHHSTLFNSKGYNLSENYARNLSGQSSLGVDLSQQWTTFSSGAGATATETQRLSFYNFMAHYNWHPFVRVSLNVEAGYRRQRGLGFDQDLFAVRSYLNWTVGKLEFRLGYEHENRDLTSESRERDFGFLRVKRSF